ncbi:MAG: ECF-type sigma factor, partial [Phycisphaerales bacterium]|nr:ECF-type sigma factor [Phycisphaerales bacterium]
MSDQPDHPTRQAEVTQLLDRAQRGEPRATEELFPIVYDELRSIAAGFLRGESNAQTMQPTALVHEAYLRLVGPDQAPWENRAHFFGAAATAIRRILIDHARHRGRVRRGGNAKRVPLDDGLAAVAPEEIDLVGLDAALNKLAAVDAQKSRVVELRFFGGLTVEQ